MVINGDPITSTNGGVNINICCSNGNKFLVKTNLELTVLEFKTLLAGNWDVPPEQQRLLYKGRILNDDQTLNSYGLQADHTVHMVRDFPLAKPTASTPTNVMNASEINLFAALLRNQGGNLTGDLPNSVPSGREMTSGTAGPNANPLPNPWNNNEGTGVTRTNPIGGAPASPIAELGVLRLPDVGMPGPPLYNQLLRNRARSQRTRNLLSDQQYMEQMASQILAVRTMLDMITQLREMVQNRNIQLRSPESMQQLMSLRQQLSQLVPQLSTTERGAQIGQDMENAVNNLMNMLGAPVAGAGGMNVASNPNVPPEELYATQLSQMQEMGLLDTQENIRALRATSGNVNAAVERLLNEAGL